MIACGPQLSLVRLQEISTSQIKAADKLPVAATSDKGYY